MEDLDILINEGVHSGVLLSIVAGIAWLTGEPFIFPSLGPSAYILATKVGDEETGPRRVIGGHIVGVVAGLASYHLLASGVAVGGTMPMSMSGFLLALSGVLSVSFTTVGMIVTETEHAPACATTLIISLGLLPNFIQSVIIIGAVVVLLGTHEIIVWLVPSNRESSDSS